MGTWPIYKKHFLQLILTKKNFPLIKYLLATFIFFLSFQSVLVWFGWGMFYWTVYYCVIRRSIIITCDTDDNILHRCMYVFLGFNEWTHWGRKMHVNWRALLIKIINSTNNYLNQQSLQNSVDSLVPDRHNFIRTSKYLHLLVPMSTNIFTSSWWRTYWVLGAAIFAYGSIKI